MPEVVEPDSRQSRPLQKRGEAPVYNVLGFVRGVPFELVDTRSLSCYSEPAWSIKESAASVASRDRASGYMSATLGCKKIARARRARKAHPRRE